MKKKIFAIAFAANLAVTAITGASLAYLKDTDSKVNTFTVGDVNIHIDEWKIEDDEWVGYTDLTKLSPIAQAKAPFNKLVETVNDGSEPAYIRTFITCPTEDYNDLGYGFNSGANAVDSTRPNGEGTMHHVDFWKDLGAATVDGKQVNIFMCVHKEAIPVGDSILSLTKIWVYDHVDNDAIGSQFDVKVFSEAIQSENLTYDEAMEVLNGNKTDLQHAADLFNNK